jgi:ATP-dependent exoDNAse (exonuclease V) alpha subunit
VQGQEFSESLALHDTRSKHFTRTHLYVALSRAKHADQIAVRS